MRVSACSNKGKPPQRLVETLAVTGGVPLSYEEAMRSPDSATWQLVMNEEMGSVRANALWTLEVLPNGLRTLPANCFFS